MLYEDFIQDFPSRCHDILDLASGPAAKNGRDVTLSLMVAASAFVIPFERLRSANSPHPMEDAARAARVGKPLHDVLYTPFLSSRFCPVGSHWFAGELTVTADSPLEAELQARPMSDEMRVFTVLQTIRNALAHGNLVTRGKRTTEALVFMKRRYEQALWDPLESTCRHASLSIL